MGVTHFIVKYYTINLYLSAETLQLIVLCTEGYYPELEETRLTHALLEWTGQLLSILLQVHF